jgi:predicted metal-dependent hydrolase
MSDEHQDDTIRRGRPFERGQSGNPAGRPKGSRNRATLAAQALFDGGAEAIAQKAQEMALGGDRNMIALFVKQILRQERPISFELGELRTADDATRQSRVLLEQVAAGEISLAEAERAMALIEKFLATLDAADFEQRLGILERCFGE